jgi:SAM-dependent methyltransferase
MKGLVRAILDTFRRPWRSEPGPSPRQAVFTTIYHDNGWQNAESRSGRGSTVARTASLRPALLALLEEFGVRSLLDAPCGDFNWMKEIPLEGIEYVGVDVVAELIERNRRLFGRRGRQFLVADVVAHPLPAADLILCRDGLVHLPDGDALRALDHFRRSTARYLLATTFPGQPANSDIAAGHWRPMNLEKAPFNLPPPLRLVSDGCPIPGYTDKALGLWELTQIPQAAGESSA